MALTYLGYGENHKKLHAQGGRFQGPLVGLQDRLDDPHDKLGLVNKVKDKQVSTKVEREVRAVPDQDLGASWNQASVKSSKGTLLKDYTRPEKRPMVAPQDENVNPNARAGGIQPFTRQSDRPTPQKKTAAFARTAAGSPVRQTELRSSGAYGAHADAQGMYRSGGSPVRSKKKQEEVVGKITGFNAAAEATNEYYAMSAGAAKSTTQGHNYVPGKAATTPKAREPATRPVKTAQISLLAEDHKQFWRPNSSVEVFRKYSSRDRDQPESHLRRMQHSQIDLAHDMRPVDVNSRIVASKPSLLPERLYGDPYAKLQTKLKSRKAQGANSHFLASGAKTNPENFIRSPRRAPKGGPPRDSSSPAKDIADDDRSFHPFNSEHYRDHVNKVEKMGLRNEGPQDHPIVFQYNGGDYRRSYFQPYEYSTAERSKVTRSSAPQSPARVQHQTPWRQ